ncbi:MAG: DNA mismatch repair protein MutS [Proteobacteria bacterium]|nr:DNA mismatch repair protein MutS [Pseudomonadota bacterium]MBU1737221.1 DNA mismatch repair protein MutS [Pseudomonadota bacterium]
MSMESEKLVVELNYRHAIIDERDPERAFSSRKMFDLLPETLMDKRTMRLVEIHDLFAAVDDTRTNVGSARLFHSMVNPSESIELIHAKHDSFCELDSNAKLKDAIEEFLVSFRYGEETLFKLLNAHIHPLAPYGSFNRAMNVIKDMLQGVKKIPQPETIYLDSLIKSILSFKGSPAYDLITGPRHRTTRGMKTRKEKKFFTPSLRFYPTRLSIGALIPAVPAIYFGLGWFTEFMNPAVAWSMLLLTGWMSVFGFLYSGVIKPIFDYETAILPIRTRLTQSNRFASAIEAVAAIDELFSFVTFSRKSKHPCVLPEITNNKSHSFIARDLRNPTKDLIENDFVPSDVSLDGQRTTFITGPNSGGKTTFCKTIVQNQILGQIGAPVMASYARINMADRITYQAPAFDTLHDEEGRFGTELKVTRDIFFATTPQSLVILDEIAEGTTTHEKMGLSVDIMNGFYAIGNNTLLVTHSFELVEQFRRQQKGQYLQVEFKDNLPTHRMVEGISRESQAHRVASKIGFSPEDIRKHLEEKGYLEPEPEENGHEERRKKTEDRRKTSGDRRQSQND